MNEPTGAESSSARQAVIAEGSSVTPMICLRGISLEYTSLQTGQRVHALDAISLDVAPNEFLTVLGPSGCGKSTMLNIIAGLLRPTGGQVLVNGCPVTRPGADRGMVFQEYALLPWKTVWQNVALGPQIQGRPRAECDELARHYIEMVHLTGFEDKYPHELSGGMRQRVAVARTLANSPQVMLMDEPFAAVDAQTRASLQEELARVWERNRLTVVFVTHNVEEAVFLGDRVLVMTPRPGRVHSLVQIGIPRGDRNWSSLDRDDRYLSIKAALADTMRTLGAPSDQSKGSVHGKV